MNGLSERAKKRGKILPSSTGLDKHLVVFYLGEDDVNIFETNGIDTEKLLLHLDKGGSVFITEKPAQGMLGSL